MTALINLSGKRYGRLLVLHRLDGAKPTKWVCLCNCGNTLAVLALNLTKTNGTKSCGCLHKEVCSALLYKHGACSNVDGKKKSSREFISWSQAKRRCTNPDSPDYKRYGARGISMCETWQISFSQFLKDMGLRPEGMSLERIDNNGNYEPTNCKWATKIEQANNRRSNRFLTYGSETLTVAEWSRKLGLNQKTLRTWLAQDKDFNCIALKMLELAGMIM